ncbi:MAG: hypothetical protein R2862_00555 [Thermoanaerobaculia bacterium]
MAQALAAEGEVAHGERLVDEQEIRAELRRDGEPEPGSHPRAVGSDRRVDDRGEAGEVDDRRQQRVAGIALEPEEIGRVTRIVAAGEPGIESQAEIGDRGQSPQCLDGPGVGRHPPLDQPEEGRLAGAVRAEDGDALSRRDLEIDPVERPELPAPERRTLLPPEQIAGEIGERVAQRAARLAAEFLADAGRANDAPGGLCVGRGLWHGSAASLASAGIG